MPEKPPTPAQAVAEALDRIIGETERDERASFARLVRAAGLDAAYDFVGASLRDLDFRDEDLRGFDFSRADLTGADFRRANLAGVRFDNAILTGAIGLAGDTHLPDFAVFSDAPFAPELVVMPAGEFMMGSTDDEEGGNEDEGPRHRVMIAQRFAIGRYPVTFDEYDRFFRAKGQNKPEDQGWGRGRLPVINVSREDARAYIAWLSQETGRAYRLPSEAEWEYASRAGTTTRYSFGDEINPENANYNYSGLGQTSEVGTYPANPWGLHDMHGNVWEWVEDGWHENYRGAPSDGSAWKDAEAVGNPRRCVLRGGSWSGNPRYCRSAYRNRIVTDYRSSSFGFRVARTLS